MQTLRFLNCKAVIERLSAKKFLNDLQIQNLKIK